MKYKKIGILGGMGPEATSTFYYKIIKYCQKKYKAEQDTDYPPMIIYSLPLFGFDESGIVDKERVLKQLIDGVKTLSDAGCDFIVMPCNTVHHFIDDLREKTKIPIISIIDEMIKKIKSDKYDCVGLLASESTLNLDIYGKHFKEHGIKYVSPAKKDYKKITSLILGIMGGRISGETKENVLDIIKEMKQKNIDAVVLGCTELPLAINEDDVNIKVYDSLQILAEASIDYAA